METLGDTYGELEKKFTNVLNTKTIKTKMIRFNDNVFMTVELRKEIMKRWKLRSRSWKLVQFSISKQLQKPFNENKKTTLWKLKCQ